MISRLGSSPAVFIRVPEAYPSAVADGDALPGSLNQPSKPLNHIPSDASEHATGTAAYSMVSSHRQILFHSTGEDPSYTAPNNPSARLHIRRQGWAGSRVEFTDTVPGAGGDGRESGTPNAVASTVSSRFDSNNMYPTPKWLHFDGEIQRGTLISGFPALRAFPLVRARGRRVRK